MTDILMPALSPTMEEGKLAKWLVKEGAISKLIVEARTKDVRINAVIAQLSNGDAAPVPKANGKSKSATKEAEARTRADAKVDVLVESRG